MMGKLSCIVIIIGTFQLIQTVPLRCVVDISKKTVDCSGKELTSTIVLVNSNDAKKIENINFSNNNIKRIESLDRFANVAKVDLSMNMIENISANAFGVTRNLASLDLSYNNIEYLDPYIFIQNKELKRLSLEGNKLTINSEMPIICSASLEILNIGTCALLTISRENLLCVPSLLDLDISGNGLTTLTPAVFLPLNKLASITLGLNRFSCDCKLQELLKWARAKKTDLSVDSTEPLFCVLPNNRGRDEYKEIEKDLNCTSNSNTSISTKPKSQNENSSSELFDYILISYDTSVQPTDGRMSVRFMGLISNKLYTIEALLSLVLFLLVIITGVLFCRHYRTVSDVSDNVSDYSVYDHFVSEKMSAQLIQKNPKDHMYAHVKK